MRPPPPEDDPFDPDSSCGATAIPTERVPGSLLLVFDRSTSMDEDPDGDRPGDRDYDGTSKWDIAEEAIDTVLSSVGDDLGTGLLLFPTGDGGDICDVTLGASVPHVEIAPLSISRPAIRTALGGGPNGGNTPIHAALNAGWDYLDTLITPGQRGLILVTDGAENCDDASRDAVLARAETERRAFGYQTFAIGLDNSSNFLSTLAVNGGTPRNDTCMASCVIEPTSCGSSADCPGGASCIFGFCADTGTPDCCHYDVSAGDFRADFESVLGEIAERFLDSCVFDLPRGEDPSSFDPSQVNVGVTFEGEDRTVLRRGSDPGVDSWDYTSDEHDSIVIQGPICDELLMGDATVEIVLGCPTILI
ncbi:MAG TPA: vWA domain-containing protein [Polyangiaceae bacterium LLY-WYZ-15_(1-7)]|nr:hypothetical protein [Myxococcales bacterium]MAT26285.1 hypothetical protein [Sandaracinus sp.]HJK95203.1 vWA domain-containing protein [Polyangiaceae bacterium LLY-WYZ-15_(1-7)]MBJ73986.1 hypothetical protein [Sandaracinus sp.]HJL04107.1 vWA domain-containing protein [Polyangiaceae bacterium LLY-WYZ-15_(1-7)]